jgi:hypothetical protein
LTRTVFLRFLGWCFLGGCCCVRFAGLLVFVYVYLWVRVPHGLASCLV